MKSSFMSSASSSSSRTPPTVAPPASSVGGGRDWSEGRADNSCYFPGCRKDTNCKCEICIASIHATLDLIPTGSSATKLSTLTTAPKKPSLLRRRPPPAIEPATPPVGSDLRSPTTSLSLTPPLDSTAKSRPPAKENPFKMGRSGFRCLPTVVFFMGLFFLVAMDLGLLRGVSHALHPSLTKEIVELFGQQACNQSVDLRGRLGILELKIGDISGGVSNCSSLGSNWEMNHNGVHFVLWRCIIYESMVEEVSIWGSPLPTSGLVSTGFSSRSLTLLSGKITEWGNEKMEATSRSGIGSSWTTKRWTSAVMVLERNTWVLEYQRRGFSDGWRLLPGLVDMLKVETIIG
ncbi:hypothetical protein HPP92_009390 [Vanilla planifolia]|uniref:Uncharacterized protein n=1 Tax=Vanilla planifolia TaxID=51239 RepID=A0A835R846_VANPL|nr:hypothetical protein HPP92_009390 [Vanilla planifolia]